jgi:flagellar hook assembly protein FlgD
MPISVVPDTIVAKVEAPYVINVQTTTGVNAINYTDGFSLLQNVPNPFSKTTSIDYAIPAEQQVTITLYDESGRLIRELVNGTQAAGNHSVSFEQDNLQAGVYLYQMKAGEFVKTRRMLILE